MSWSSGVQVDGSGQEFVSDAPGTVARITDAEVRADERDRLRPTLTVITGGIGPGDGECDDDCTCGDDLGATS